MLYAMENDLFAIKVEINFLGQQNRDCSNISQEIETMGDDSLEPGFHSLQFESIILSFNCALKM